MSSEILKLTADIVVSHASLTELTPEQLVTEIRYVYNMLSSLEGGGVSGEPVSEKADEAGGVKPSIPLKDIVKAKYVVCLECGKEMKTLKMHLRKVHGLMPKNIINVLAWTLKSIPWCVRIILRLGAKWLKIGILERGRKEESEGLSERCNKLLLIRIKKSKN